MGLRSLIPDASGPVAPASNNVRIIWADPKPAPSSAPGMSFAPASHVQRALQSKPSAAPDPQRDDPVSGFFRKIGEFFSPNKPRPERDLAAEGRRYREQAEQRGLTLGHGVIDYMLRYSSRDLSKLHEFLVQLDRYGLQKKQAITVPLLKEWLNADAHE